MTDLAELVQRHALLTMEKQLHAADVIGERDWQADLGSGTIVFGGDLEMRAQLLGTEAADPGSWLWGWANEGDYDAQLTAGARRLRDLGGADAVPEFAEAELALAPEVNGDLIAFAAVGVLRTQAYYSAPAGGGTRAILLLDHPDLELPAPDAIRLVGVLTAVVETGAVADWPTALQAYAGQRGVPFGRDGDDIELGEVSVTLDELGRVAGIATEAQSAGADPPGRRGLRPRLRRR